MNFEEIFFLNGNAVFFLRFDFGMRAASLILKQAQRNDGHEVTRVTCSLSHIYAYPLHHRCIAMPSVRASIAALLLVAAAVHVSADDQGQPIRCAGFANRSVLRTLPASAINDGYCDCPHDGQDEPDTGACAGSVDGGWAGVPAADGGQEA